MVTAFWVRKRLRPQSAVCQDSNATAAASRMVKLASGGDVDGWSIWQPRVGAGLIGVPGTNSPIPNFQTGDAMRTAVYLTLQLTELSARWFVHLWADHERARQLYGPWRLQCRHLLSPPSAPLLAELRARWMTPAAPSAPECPPPSAAPTDRAFNVVREPSPPLHTQAASTLRAPRSGV